MFRGLVFGRASISEYLHFVHEVFIDGTFKVVPKPFYQMVVILGKRGDFVAPLMFALLPCKSAVCYNLLFAEITEVRC